MAYSSGAYILCSGTMHNRMVTPHSRVLLHEAYFEEDIDVEDEDKDSAELFDDVYTRVLDKFCLLLECEKEDLKEALKEDIFLTAEETLRCQLVDRILKDGELFDDNCLSHLQGPTFHSDFED